MPLQINSPTRPSRSKRESLTITRAVGKALSDVMNKDKDSTVVASSADSDTAGTTNSPARSKTGAIVKSTTASTRDDHKLRPSLDAKGNTSSDSRSTPKLIKRPPSSSGSKPITRSHTSMGPPPPLVAGDKATIKPAEKPSKPRASLTLRSLTSALQPKATPPPTALPKYKPRSDTDTLGLPRSAPRKRLSDWDVDKTEDNHKPQGDAKGSDTEEDFVTVDRPISPLPRRVTRKSVLPVSLSVTPSTPPKRTVLHKASSSSTSTPPRASKTPKTSATSASPMARLSTQSRPASVASIDSLRTTPVQGATRKPAPVSRAKTISSTRSVRRRPTLADSPASSTSKIESSPGNPFHLPETSGSSLLSPPLSPFLEGVSIDSIDAGDVSALLSSIVSPTKPTPAPSRSTGQAPPQTPSHSTIFPGSSNSPAPQTPASSRPMSMLTTDHRQSVLSLRQFLENSGDLEHLLSQPLPSIFTPDARERLLSFGSASGFPPPPFPSAAHRPEPQTPCPVPDGHTFTSISQVLFPSAQGQAGEQHRAEAGGAETPTGNNGEGDLVKILKMQLSSAESQRMDRDARIGSLEQQLTLLREAREREAAELSTQVSHLEERLQELLGDREREAEMRANEMEVRLRDKDAEWERQLVAAVTEAQEHDLVDRERLLSVERRKGSIRSATAAWDRAREIACSELELVRSNRRFVEVVLAGLDASMEQLRQ